MNSLRTLPYRDFFESFNDNDGWRPFASLTQYEPWITTRFPEFALQPASQSIPQTSVNHRNDGGLTVIIAAPGVMRKDFLISLADTALIVELFANEDNPGAFIEPFVRSWQVDKGVVADDVTASHRNGVLTIEVEPSSATVASVTIPIK